MTDEQQAPQSLWEKIKSWFTTAKESETAEKAGEMAGKAWDKTKDVAEKTWEKTKDVAEDVKEKVEDRIEDMRGDDDEDEEKAEE